MGNYGINHPLSLLTWFGMLLFALVAFSQGYIDIAFAVTIGFVFGLAAEKFRQIEDRAATS